MQKSCVSRRLWGIQMLPLHSASPPLLRAEMALTELYNVTFLFRSLSFLGQKCLWEVLFRRGRTCQGDAEDMGIGKVRRLLPSGFGFFMPKLSQYSAKIWRNSSLVPVSDHQLLGIWWQVKYKAVFFLGCPQVPAGAVCNKAPIVLSPGDTEGKTTRV